MFWKLMELVLYGRRGMFAAPDDEAWEAYLHGKQAYPPPAVVRSIDDDYRELLRTGYTSGEDKRVHDADLEVWRKEVAEPWFEAIRERAQRDGLEVHVYDGWDVYGIGYASPAAILLRPDGSRYPDLTWRLVGRKRHERKQLARRDALLLADWGDALRNARVRTA